MSLEPIDGDWQPVPSDFRVCGGFHQCNTSAGQACGSLFDPQYRDALYSLSDEHLSRDSVLKELNYGITNFDNILNAFLTVFQCMTLEGWVDIMTLAIDAHSLFVSSVLFLVMIFVMHYLFINLAVSVLAYNISKMRESEYKALNQKKITLIRTI